jgi:hypothetical protein
MTFSVGYNPDSLSPVDSATAIANAFIGADKPWYPAHAYAGWAFSKVQCTEMDESGPLFYELAVNSLGTAVGETPPPNVTLLVRKGTALGGRKNRGRIFAPAALISESQIDKTGVVDPTYQGIVQDYWDNFLEAMGASDVPMVLLHSTPGLPTPVSSVTLENMVATQRRRLRR